MDLIYPKPKKQKEEEAEEVTKFANMIKFSLHL
jgi:hypothetical protein